MWAKVKEYITTRNGEEFAEIDPAYLTTADPSYSDIHWTHALIVCYV
jgi:hypothetical protein